MFFKSFLKRSKKLTLCIKCQTDGEDVVNFCGLLCKQDLWTPIKFSKNIKYVHIILLQFCSLSAIHLNRYHVMHSVVIIFAQDPQLPPPYTSRFQNFSFTCTWDFCKKNRTYSEKSDMYNFLCFCKSHQFFTISQRLLWYLTYLLPMSFTKGPKPFYIFFSKQFLSNFVSVV